jgi:hypothetical protein
MGAKVQLKLFSVGVVFFAMQAGSAFGMDEALRARLGARWIPARVEMGETDGRIPPERFSELLAIMSETPSTQNLLNQVTQALQLRQPQALSQMVYLCRERRSVTLGEQRPLGPTEMLRETAGHLTAEFRQFEVDLNPSGRYAWDSTVVAAVRSGLAASESNTASRHLLTILSVSTICIDRDTTLLDAFSIFVHELTHLQGALLQLQRGGQVLLGSSSGLHAEIGLDSLLFSDSRDYASRILETPGHELDAAISQTQAVLAIEALARVHDVHLATRAYFSPDGRLVDRAGLKRHLLVDAGYQAALEAEFPEVVRRDLERSGALVVALERGTAPRIDRNLSILRAGGPSAALNFYQVYSHTVAEQIRQLRAHLSAVDARFSQDLRGASAAQPAVNSNPPNQGGGLTLRGEPQPLPAENEWDGARAEIEEVSNPFTGH